MVFNLKDLAQTPFEKFKEFIGKGRCFKEVADYYISNNLQLQKGQPVVYCFKSLTGKKYYGKANDIFKRLKHYITLNGSYINNYLKDDLLFNGQKYFTFAITTTYRTDLITIDNIIDAENYYTSNGGDRLYNKINKNLKLEIRQAKPAKNLKKSYNKLKTDQDGFDDMLNKGFIL